MVWGDVAVEDARCFLRDVHSTAVDPVQFVMVPTHTSGENVALLVGFPFGSGGVDYLKVWVGGSGFVCAGFGILDCRHLEPISPQEFGVVPHACADFYDAVSTIPACKRDQDFSQESPLAGLVVFEPALKVEGIVKVVRH